MSTDSKKKYNLTSQLLSAVPQQALDAVFGTAALIECNLNLNTLSCNWNEFMARSGRSDLSRNSITGSSVLQFFRNEQQRQVFKNLLASMTTEELGSHHQVVDLGSKESPFYVQFYIFPVWCEGLMAGYFLQCIDVTKEHVNRLTLIDHDRELLSLRETKDNIENEFSKLKEKIGAAVKDKRQIEKELEVLREKAERKDKTLKAAIKQAELAADTITGKDRELKQANCALKQSEETAKKLEQTLEQRTAELTDREEEIQLLKEKTASLQTECRTLSEEADSVKSKDQESAEARLQDLLVEYESLKVDSEALYEKTRTQEDELEVLKTEHAASQSKIEDCTKARDEALPAGAIYQNLLGSFSISASDFAEQLCREVQTLADALFTVCTVYDSASNEVRPFAGSDAPEPFRPDDNGQWIPAESTLLGLTAKDGHPTRYASLQSSKAYAAWAATAIQQNFDLIWTFPIHNRKDIIGCLHLFFKTSETNLPSERVDLIERLINEMSPLVRLAWKNESTDTPLICTDRLLNALPDPSCWMDSDGRIQAANRSFCKLLENKHSVCIGMPLASRLSASSSAELEAFLKTPDQPDPFSLVLTSNSGESQITLIPQFENGGLLGCLITRKLKSATNGSINSQQLNDSPLEGVRRLSGDLADAFGDLLTAVMGHASLAAVDEQADSPTLPDIVAIGQSAGDAAKLVRKLHALSGERGHAATADFPSALSGFITQEYAGRPEPQPKLETLCSVTPVRIDTAALEIILQGMTEHAESSSNGKSPVRWTLSEQDGRVRLSMIYSGAPNIPSGWFDGDAPALQSPGYDLYFAREIARAFGGRLEIDESQDSIELTLRLPVVKAPQVAADKL